MSTNGCNYVNKYEFNNYFASLNYRHVESMHFVIVVMSAIRQNTHVFFFSLHLYYSQIIVANMIHTDISTYFLCYCSMMKNKNTNLFVCTLAMKAD